MMIDKGLGKIKKVVGGPHHGSRMTIKQIAFSHDASETWARRLTEGSVFTWKEINRAHQNQIVARVEKKKKSTSFGLNPAAVMFSRIQL
jgi:hypothetical protein